MLNSLTFTDHARLSRLGALGVCAVAGATCLWLLVRMFWLALPQTDDTSVVAAPAPVTTPAPQSVAKWHLFGNPQNVMLAQMMRNAPATTLKLTLRGTLSLSDPKQGIAMIQDEHGAERAYNVGDTVADRAKLAAVFADHVVIEHEGVAETLSLPRDDAPVPAAPANQQNPLATLPGKASSVPPSYIPPSMASGALDWSHAQKQLQIDPTQLAQQVHVEPVFVNGKLTGARLSGAGKVGTLMQQAGLKPTDIITAVNGTTVAGLSNPQQLMDNLKDASSLQVTVLRDGKPATLTLNLH